MLHHRDLTLYIGDGERSCLTMTPHSALRCWSRYLEGHQPVELHTNVDLNSNCHPADRNTPTLCYINTSVQTDKRWDERVDLVAASGVMLLGNTEAFPCAGSIGLHNS